MKIISKSACENINRYAFEYAKKMGRKRIIACHKAGVMKMGDGLFIETASQIAKEYPEITYSE